MEVDNFNKIKNFIKPESKDDFWFGQVLIRRKDNPDLNKDSKLIKSYYIESVDYLNSISDQIKKLCKDNNARFYFNPNVRSYKRCCLGLAEKSIELLKNGQEKSISSALDSVCGYTGTPDRDKYFIIDIDLDDDFIVVNTDMCVEEPYKKLFNLRIISHIINNCKPYGNKIISILKTKSGVHIISKPFNKIEFLTECSKENDGILDKLTKEDIKSNSPTLCYYVSNKI